MTSKLIPRACVTCIPEAATYTVYTNPNTTLHYRYFRNGDNARGMEIIGTDSPTAVYRSITSGSSGSSTTDMVTMWRHQSREPALTSVTAYPEEELSGTHR